MTREMGEGQKGKEDRAQTLDTKETGIVNGSSGLRDSGLSSALTHIDLEGRVNMVDVGAKTMTVRTARARCRVVLGPKAYALVKDNNIRKGDVLTVAQLAGIMGAKQNGKSYPAVP